MKGDKPLAVLCNRGLHGIDGTVSTALGVAQHFEQTTFLTGDFTLQHDLGGLALQREIAQVAAERGKLAPSIVVVLLNNNGGGILQEAVKIVSMFVLRAPVLGAAGRRFLPRGGGFQRALSQGGHSERVFAGLRGDARDAGHKPHRSDHASFGP